MERAVQTMGGCGGQEHDSKSCVGCLNDVDVSNGQADQGSRRGRIMFSTDPAGVDIAQVVHVKDQFL